MFPYIGNFIIPTDEPILFRGVGLPPTSDAYPCYNLRFCGEVFDAVPMDM